MDAKKLYDIFRELFPLFDVKSFDKIGEYSLIINTSIPGMTFIFTFKSPMEWRFETSDIFGKQLVKENTNEI